MPRGEIKYEIVRPRKNDGPLPWMFGRASRERIIAMLAVAGPMHWYEMRESLGHSEVGEWKDYPQGFSRLWNCRRKHDERHSSAL